MDISLRNASIPQSKPDFFKMDNETEAKGENYLQTQQHQSYDSTYQEHVGRGLDLFSVQDDSLKTWHYVVDSYWNDTVEDFFKYLLNTININDFIPSSIIVERKPHYITIYDSYGNVVSENKENQHCPDMTILHLAAGAGDWRFVQVLLQEENINVNITDSDGNTPLHYCAMAKFRGANISRDHEKCADLLLSKGNTVLLKKKNYNSITVLQFASRCKNFPVLKVILKHGIRKKNILPTYKRGGTELDKLADCKPWDIANENVIAECAEILLKSYKVNPNEEAAGGLTAMHRAALSSNISVLKVIMKWKLTNKNATVNGNNVLHCVVNKFVGTSQYIEKTIECLDYLIKEHNMDINSRNDYDETPLVVALKHNNQDIALHLLKHGAYMGGFGCDESKLMDLYHPNTLESYFNECIVEMDQQYYFLYKFIPKFTGEEDSCNNMNEKTTNMDGAKKFENVNEMSFVSNIAEKCHTRHLLTHPLISSFICVKYYNTSIFRWLTANVILYLIYLIALNMYVNVIMLKDKQLVIISWYIIAIATGCICCKELMQILIMKTKYLTDFKNWIEIPQIITTIFLLNTDLNTFKKNTELFVFSVLLSWFVFVLVTGNLPLFAVQFQMLLTVLHTFFYHMLWYCIIIVGYATCFFLIFHCSLENGSELFKTSNSSLNNTKTQRDGTFNYPWLSVERAFVMMTGELNYIELRPTNLSILSHLVIASFIIIISIVLLNLLHGLAVHDTQAIMQEAAVLSLVARVREIKRLEKFSAHICKTFPKFGWLRYILNTSILEKLIRTYNQPNIGPHICENIDRNVNISYMTSIISVACQYFRYCDKLPFYKIDPSILISLRKLINEKKINQQLQLERRKSKELKQDMISPRTEELVKKNYSTV